MFADMDECHDNTSTCNHICNNNEGSYSCQCYDGYQLANNAKCIGNDAILFEKATILHRANFQVTSCQQLYNLTN